VKPYYEHNGITIYHGEAVEIMPHLVCSSVVTDPPYGFNSYRTDKNGFSSELALLIKRTRSSAIFGYPEQLCGFCINYAMPEPSEWIVWMPPNKPGNSGKPLPKSHEAIVVFGETFEIPQRHRRDRNPQRAIQRGLDPSWCPMGDVWEHKSPGLGYGEEGTERLHPNQKPVDLCADLVRMLSHKKETVADPFCGSGSVLLACAMNGRLAIGIEIEERYCEIAAKRLSREVNSP
jgi:site-specific DNA-methyltransferase (adenine-specific)